MKARNTKACLCLVFILIVLCVAGCVNSEEEIDGDAANTMLLDEEPRIAELSDVEKISVGMRLSEVEEMLNTQPSRTVSVGENIWEYIIDNETAAYISFDNEKVISVLVSDAEGNILYYDRPSIDSAFEYREGFDDFERLIDYSKYFTIIETEEDDPDSNYAYQIINFAGQIIAEGTSWLRPPEIYQQDWKVISLFEWGGASRYMQFFNIYDDRVSEVFEYFATPADFYTDSRTDTYLFAYFTGDRERDFILVVQNIFDNDFYIEIALGPFPPIPPPVYSITFLNEREIFVDYDVFVGDEDADEIIWENVREIIQFR